MPRPCLARTSERALGPFSSVTASERRARLNIPQTFGSLRRDRLGHCLEMVNDAEAMLTTVSGALAALCRDEDGQVSARDQRRPVTAQQVQVQAQAPPVLRPTPVFDSSEETEAGEGDLVQSKDTLNSGTSYPGPFETQSPSNATDVANRPSKSQASVTSSTVHKSWADEGGRPCDEPSCLLIDQILMMNTDNRNHFASDATQQFGQAIAKDASLEWRRVRQVKTGDNLILRRVTPKYIPIMHPEAGSQLIWLTLNGMFILYEMFAVPIYFAFDILTVPGDLLFVVASIINAFFLIDIPKSFFTGFMDHKGDVIMSPSQIAHEYVRKWFALDLVAGIPWEWLTMETGRTKFVRAVKVVRLLRLTRLLRLMKLRNALVKFETFVERNKYCTFGIGIFKSLTLLFAVTHWAACAWFAIGGGSDEDRTAGIASGDVQKYVYSLYFSWMTMTTVGYGDVTPQDFHEVCFVLVLLFISSVVFAFLMGTLTDLIATLNLQEHELSEKKCQLSRYMVWRGVPRKLMMRIRQHLLFMWDTNEGYDLFEEGIKDQLSPVLKAELCHHIYGNVIVRAPFLSWMAEFPTVVRSLSNMASSMFLEPCDMVFTKGQPNVQIFVLLSGQVYLSRNQHLWEGEDEPVRPPAPSANATHQSDEDEANAMAIPRGRNTRRRVSAQTTTMLDALDAFSSSQAGPNGASSATDSDADDDVLTPKELSRPTKNNLDSVLLCEVQKKLHQEDMARHRAAIRLQRRWKRKRARQRKGNGARQSFSRVADNSEWDGFYKVHSKKVRGPAYFGESCLWIPFAMWEIETPPPYMYNARCETRCELVYIGRDSIKTVIEIFSPWLEERFDFFRQKVANQLKALYEQSSRAHVDFVTNDSAETYRTADTTEKCQGQQT